MMPPTYPLIKVNTDHSSQKQHNEPRLDITFINLQNSNMRRNFHTQQVPFLDQYFCLFTYFHDHCNIFVPSQQKGWETDYFKKISQLSISQPNPYNWTDHYSDVQITSVSIVCSNVSSGADQRKHRNFASLGFVRGIHRWPVVSPHNGPVTRKCFHLMTSSCAYAIFVQM